MTHKIHNQKKNNHNKKSNNKYNNKIKTQKAK